MTDTGTLGPVNELSVDDARRLDLPAPRETNDISLCSVPLRCLVLCRCRSGREQSGEYFVNKRGNSIHVRSYLPPPADVHDIKAVVLFSHG